MEDERHYRSPKYPTRSPEQVLINPPKVPGTVEDSHAKLAAEMRREADNNVANLMGWAARVEALFARERKHWGEAHKRTTDSFHSSSAALETALAAMRSDREAREAEIAKVREELALYAEDTENDYLDDLAARLGGVA